MNRKVVFAEKAIFDLENRFDYLLPLAGEKTATAFIEGIRAYCLGFDIFPERGTQRDDLGQGLRLVGYKHDASIAFIVTDSEVTILRVFMRGQDIDTELS